LSCRLFSGHGFDERLASGFTETFVDEQVARRGYATSSEYVRELIRIDQDRQHLRGLLLEGAESPATVAADDAYFNGLRDRVRQTKSK
jgi:antitoxin ParD1/3/4